VELVQYLFTVPGLKVFLSSKLNQDILEKYFGIVRQNRGSNENPTVLEFKDITQTLRVANSVCRSVRIKGGNCRRAEKRKLDLAEEIEESKPLPKRARKSSRARK